MTDKQRQDILQNLGHHALTEILAGSPEVIPDIGFQCVIFWFHGLECEYFFETSPPLLRLVEADKEFTSFDQLVNEVTL